MKILIVYGSTEGQTRRIAEKIADHLRDSGHESQLYDTERRARGINVDSSDAIVVASPVHQQLHKKSVRDFVVAHLRLLETKPSAFISVSLSSAVPGGEQYALEYVYHFFETSGWRPLYYQTVAGALRYSEYDFFKEQVLRHVVFKDRSKEILLGRDHEFTDWNAVYEFVDGFVQEVADRPSTVQQNVTGMH